MAGGRTLARTCNHYPQNLDGGTRSGCCLAGILPRLRADFCCSSWESTPRLADFLRESNRGERGAGQPPGPRRLSARAGDDRACPGQPGRGARAPAVPRHLGATRRPARPVRLAERAGGLERAQGNPAGARRLLQQSLGITERLSDLPGPVRLAAPTGMIERAQGNPAEARRLLQQSRGITERLGDLRGQSASPARAGDDREYPGQPGQGAAAAAPVPRHRGATRRPRGQAASLHVLAIIEMPRATRPRRGGCGSNRSGSGGSSANSTGRRRP